MELTYSIYELLGAFWIAAWLLLFFRTYLPAMEVVAKVNPNTAVYKHRYLGGIAYGLMLLPCVPFLLQVLLDDDKRYRFLQSFVEALIGDNNNG